MRRVAVILLDKDGVVVEATLADGDKMVSIHKVAREDVDPNDHRKFMSETALQHNGEVIAYVFKEGNGQ
jgi:hypothetical protein